MGDSKRGTTHLNGDGDDGKKKRSSKDKDKKSKEKDKEERRKKRQELLRQKKLLQEKMKEKEKDKEKDLENSGSKPTLTKTKRVVIEKQLEESEDAAEKVEAVGSPEKRKRSNSKTAKPKETKSKVKADKDKDKSKLKEQKRAEKEKKDKEREERKKKDREKKKEDEERGKKTPTLFKKKPSANGNKSKQELRPAFLSRSVSLKQIPGEHKRKNKMPTFIHGFDPFLLAKGRNPTIELDEKKKAELAARKDSLSKPASGNFAIALLPFEAPAHNKEPLSRQERITSLMTGRGRIDFPESGATSVSRSQQLRSMKKHRFWFSTVDFERGRQEGARKAKVDSLESQLSMKWDDFMTSLPKMADRKYRQVREGYDEKGKQQLETQGEKFMAALRFNKPESGQSSPAASLASKFALSGSAQAATVVDKVVMPSYLQGFTGEEVEENKPIIVERVGKHAICPFLLANPNIAVDAQYDLLFGECAAEEPGLYIWRIEDLLPMEAPDEDYPDIDAEPTVAGTLYSEDCYIMLSITSEEEAKKFYIYNWVGKKATQDKLIASAIRARELNILLKNKSSIRREYEAEESDDFLELYNYDIKYIPEGGTASGFRPAVQFVQEPRMYRLTFTKQRVRKPRRRDGRVFDEDDYIEVEKENFVMTQVRISALSLTQSDVFIVDGGSDGWLFQWNGSLASKKLRFKGYEIRTRINRYERACRSVECEIEEGEEHTLFWKPKYKPRVIREEEKTPEEQDAWADLDDEDEDERCFWDYMKEKEYAGDDIAHPPSEGTIPRVAISFFKTSISEGRPTLITLRTPGDNFAPAMRMLDSNAVNIMDADTEIFVWIGKKSSSLERQVAMGLARKFYEKQRDRPSWVPIVTIYENTEPTTFITKFPDWCAKLFAPLPSNFATSQHARHRIAPPNSPPCITVDLLLEAPVPKQYSWVDNAQGTVEVWAIEDGKPTFTKLPSEERGHFHTGDCYLVLYTYYDPTDNNKQAYICYFWEGRSSSNRWWPAFLFGFYPVLEKKIKTYGGRPPRKLRISEHKEPPHFTALFNGSIIIHKGNRKPKPTLSLKKKEKKKELWHMHRTGDVVHTVQVRAQAKSLNSNDAFLLRTPEKVYLWYGSGTEFADSQAFSPIVDRLRGSRDMEQLDEGEEVPAFWNLLGGWTSYTCNPEFTKKYKVKPRLYCFSNSTGKLSMWEVQNYFQTDLKSTNVYILDTQHEVYTWTGKRASESLFKQVLDFANKYVREVAVRRKRFVELISMMEGEEPLEFTRHFHTWVTKEQFLDPIIARESALTDMLFRDYKARELEEKKRKELLALERATLPPLTRLDWIEIIRKELPDLVVDSGESDVEEYSSDSEFEYDEQNSDEPEKDEQSDSDSDTEFVYQDMNANDVEDKAEEEKISAAEYMIKKVTQNSAHYRLYHQ